MINDIYAFIKRNNFGVVGITGGAGSGKSYLTQELGFQSYSLDSSFIGDSEFRKSLLEKKQGASFQDFLDAANQYNWWDWDKIEVDIKQRMIESRPLIVEGAILGSPSILELYDAIIFIKADGGLRFDRLVKRDGHKRTYKELIDRWKITNQSEENHYATLFRDYPEKLYLVDSDYDFLY